jgi:hypothetical protein
MPRSIEIVNRQPLDCCRHHPVRFSSTYCAERFDLKHKSKMPGDSINVLRAVGAAADLPSFLQLVTSRACGAIICSIEDGDDFNRQQRHGFSALVLAALSRGLQLYNSAAETAGKQGSSPGAAQSHEPVRLVEMLSLLAMTVLTNTKRCLLHWGEGSQQAKNMEQELLDSGAHIEGVP